MLDSKQCDAFYAVVETGSFENAGIRLCITASAVTQRVQALEKNLGQLLIIRARPCTMTHAGQRLYQHLQHSKRLEDALLHEMVNHRQDQFFKAVIASNADSLATWLLPTLKDALLSQKIALELILDDQSRTYSLLEKGTVSACISIESQPMKGCHAELLGAMRYKMVATPQFKRKWFKEGLSRNGLRDVPAIIFSHNDQLHFDFLQKQFGLVKGMYPYHVIPSSEQFVHAVSLGLGYGIMPEFQINMFRQRSELIDLLPDELVDVPLYWHYWTQQAEPFHFLTQHIIQHARKVLRYQDS